MKAKRTNLPYILLDEVNKNNRVITCNPIDLDTKNGVINSTNNHVNTILDDNISIFGGAIPLPEGYKLFNPFAVALLSNTRTIQINTRIFKYIENKCPELLFTIPPNAYLPIPKNLNDFCTTDLGIDVLTILQKRMDDMIFYYNMWAEEQEMNNVLWLQGYKRLLVATSNILYKKGGLVDRAVGCLWPYSLRAVIVPDPTLAIDEIEIPKRVLKSWVNGRPVREAYEIDMKLDLEKAAECMDGKKVIVGRQPSHRISNLMSFKLRVT